MYDYSLHKQYFPGEEAESRTYMIDGTWAGRGLPYGFHEKNMYLLTIVMFWGKTQNSYKACQTIRSSFHHVMKMRLMRERMLIKRGFGN